MWFKKWPGLIQSRRQNDPQPDNEQAGDEGGPGDRQLRRVLSHPQLRRHFHPHQLLLHHPAGDVPFKWQK